MRITFLRGYRGVHTAEEYYEAGAVVDLDAGAAIIAEGAAEAAPEPEPEAAPEPEPPPTPPPAAGKKGR